LSPLQDPTVRDGHQHRGGATNDVAGNQCGIRRRRLLLYKTLHGREAPAIELSHIWSRAGKAQQILKEPVMSDQSQPETGGVEPPGRRRRQGRRWLVVVTLLLAGALTGAAASRAVSQHHWRGESFMHPAFDPARAQERADRAVRHLAIEIDASNEQQ